EDGGNLALQLFLRVTAGGSRLGTRAKARGKLLLDRVENRKQRPVLRFARLEERQLAPHPARGGTVVHLEIQQLIGRKQFRDIRAVFFLEEREFFHVGGRWRAAARVGAEFL